MTRDLVLGFLHAIHGNREQGTRHKASSPHCNLAFGPGTRKAPDPEAGSLVLDRTNSLDEHAVAKALDAKHMVAILQADYDEQLLHDDSPESTG